MGNNCFPFFYVYWANPGLAASLRWSHGSIRFETELFAQRTRFFGALGANLLGLLANLLPLLLVQMFLRLLAGQCFKVLRQGETHALAQ